MAVEVTQNLTQVTISSVGVAGVNGTSGTSGTFGNVLSSSFYISGSIIPSVGDGESTSSFSLGSSTNAWKDLWISEGTIYFIGGNLQTQSISLNENNEIVLSSFNLNTASLITTASYNEFTSSFGDFTSSIEIRVIALEDFTSSLSITGSGTSGTSGLSLSGSAGSDGTSGTSGTSFSGSLDLESINTFTSSIEIRVIALEDFTSSLSGSGIAGSSGTSGTAGTSALVDTLLFATTGSNTFVGNQTITGSLNIGGDNSTIILPNHPSAPTSPSSGSLYFNTTDSHFYGWDGVQWKQLDN